MVLLPNKSRILVDKIRSFQRYECLNVDFFTSRHLLPVMSFGSE